MATLYSTTGAGDIGQENSVSIIDTDAKLLAKGHSERDFKHTGDKMPLLEPRLAWSDCLVLQVFDSEPKTTLFPKSGFYHLRNLTVKNAVFLLKPEK